MPPELLLAAQTELGECPVWDPLRGALFFMDVTEKKLHRLGWEDRRWTRLDLPSLGGGLALAADGSLIAGLQSGIHRLDADSGQATLLAQPEPDKPNNRLNEGKCDPAGRFWVGSMSTIDRSPSGSLYRMERDGAVARVLDGVVIPNALVWLPTGRMLFADSFAKVIWSFAYEAETGDVHDRQVFRDCSDQPGIPDGAAVDAEGCIWNAQFGGGRVVRYDRSGRIVDEVALPATQVTSCAFAGPDLRYLAIITTKRLLDAEERRRQVHAGDLFVVEPRVPGLPVPVFGG